MVKLEKETEVSRRHQVLSQAYTGKSLDELLKDLEVQMNQSGSNRSRGGSTTSSPSSIPRKLSQPGSPAPSSPLPTPPPSLHTSINHIPGRPRTPPMSMDADLDSRPRTKSIPESPTRVAPPAVALKPKFSGITQDVPQLQSPPRKGSLLSKPSGARESQITSHAVPDGVSKSYNGMVSAIQQGVKLKKVDPPVRHLFCFVFQSCHHDPPNCYRRSRRWGEGP